MIGPRAFLTGPWPALPALPQRAVHALDELRAEAVAVGEMLQRVGGIGLGLALLRGRRILLDAVAESRLALDSVPRLAPELQAAVDELLAGVADVAVSLPRLGRAVLDGAMAGPL